MKRIRDNFRQLSAVFHSGLLIFRVSAIFCKHLYAAMRYPSTATRADIVDLLLTVHLLAGASRFLVMAEGRGGNQYVGW